MANDIYLQLGIDSSKLKRDYLKNPLKKIGKSHKLELPYKEDIIYLYINKNLSQQIICKYFNISPTTLFYLLKYYKIKRDRKLAIIHRIDTCRKKYGKDYITQTDNFKEKVQNTILLKYGSINISKTKYFKEKYKETMKQHYNVDHFSKTNKFKTIMKKNNSVIQNKRYNTMKKNNSFNTSKFEEQVNELLKQKFDEIKRQYSDERYPFRVDFYIPKLDLFIEIQGTWHHGKEPYIGSKEQLNIVKLWENKNTKQYVRAIEIWTKRDVLKRETAKENNLNYLEFFTVEQFMEWYNKNKY